MDQTPPKIMDTNNNFKSRKNSLRGILMWCFLLGLISLFHHSQGQAIPKVYQNLERYYEKKDFDACIKLVNEVELLAKNQRDTLVANSFSYVGDAYYQTGDFTKAISWFEREKILRAGLGLTGTTAYSSSLYNLAYVNLQAGNYRQASAAAQQLIENDKKLFAPTTEEFVSSILSTVDIYMQLDKFVEAEALLKSTIKQQVKNSAYQGILLSKLGDLYTLINQYSNAAKALQAATSILEKKPGKNSPEYVAATINMGILNMSRGKFPEAEEAFDYALGEMSEQDESYLATLNNQALVYQNLGQLERAEKIFRDIKSRDSISVGVSHPDFAITLSNLGLVYSDEGKHLDAERALLRALEIQKSNNEAGTVSYARKLNNLARINRMAGAPDKAIPLHEQALAIFKKTLGENSPEYATTAFNLGIAYWKTGKGLLGLKYLKTSASIRASKLGKKHPKYAESIQKIGEYQWEQKQFNEAQRSFGEVFDNYYYQIDVTFPVLTEEEKAKFYYVNMKPSMEKFNSFAMEYRVSNPLILGDVYNQQINTKGAIMYATEKVKAAILSSNDTVLINQFELWHAQRERVAKLFSQNAESKQLDSLVQRTDLLEKELVRKSAVFADQFIKKLSWQEIQKTLKTGEAAIEVVRFKMYSPAAGGSFDNKVTYAFLIVTPLTKNQPDLVLATNGTEMEGKFLNYYRNNINYILDDHQSYQNYFKPITEYLKKNQVRKVYFSPDGVYNQININTFKNAESHKFLLDEYDFRLITNTRELVEKKAVKSKDQSSILLGYPKFNLETSMTGSQEAATRSVTRGGNLTRTLRGGLLRHMRGESGISILPGTQKEIQQIAAFTSKPEIYLEDKASEDHLKSIKSPTVLHIATHGYFLEEDDLAEKASEGASNYVPNPLLKAGIILAGAENFLRTGIPVNDAGDDGVLTAYEAMNLNLENTELVVLSACETGLGIVKNGEGVYGLQRAFKLAGARNIVMSLWSVDDAATQELMSLFYEERSKTTDQQEAFHIAQQKLKVKYEHPFYWGAFIMIGL